MIDIFQKIEESMRRNLSQSISQFIAYLLNIYYELLMLMKPTNKKLKQLLAILSLKKKY